MAKNLSELPARTATADTDLIHVNTGGTNNDYKETKANFLADVRARYQNEFSASTLITTQADALGVGTHFGRISGATPAATGVPKSTNYYVDVRVYNTNVAVIILQSVDMSERYYQRKAAGSWSGTWTQMPTGFVHTVHSQTNSLFSESYKYDDGRLIINMRATHTVTINTASGAGYWGTIERLDWPVSFNSKPSVTFVSEANGTNAWIWGRNGATETQTPSFYAGRFVAANENTLNVIYHAEGRWK